MECWKSFSSFFLILFNILVNWKHLLFICAIWICHITTNSGIYHLFHPLTHIKHGILFLNVVGKLIASSENMCVCLCVCDVKYDSLFHKILHIITRGIAWYSIRENNNLLLCMFVMGFVSFFFHLSCCILILFSISCLRVPIFHCFFFLFSMYMFITKIDSKILSRSCFFGRWVVFNGFDWRTTSTCIKQPENQ